MTDHAKYSIVIITVMMMWGVSMAVMASAVSQTEQTSYSCGVIFGIRLAGREALHKDPIPEGDPAYCQQYQDKAYRQLGLREPKWTTTK